MSLLAGKEAADLHVSKKVENHCHIPALHVLEFCRIHQTLRITPAMATGLADHVWTLEELIELMPEPAVSESNLEKQLIAKALGAIMAD